jgi:hypothetical protein
VVALAGILAFVASPCWGGKPEKEDNEGRLDLVNWIINQGVVGDPSACGGTYTYGDIQRTIWALIEDQQSGSGLGPWTQCRVNEIIAAAQANGEDFVPGCDEFVAVIQNPERPAFIIWGCNLAIDMLNCQKKERSTWKPS